ncbi:hypothetical protein EON83_16310 [bacterium]|nr:MAG: hypothetical protein EON83_16310 [bacterium]
MPSAILLSALLAGSAAPQTESYELKSPTSTLRVMRDADGSFGLRLDAQTTQFEQKAPLAIEVVDEEGGTRWVYGGYSKVNVQKGGLECRGEVASPNGTRFLFFDQYTRDSDGFQLKRRVEIASPNSRDVGFGSRFGLAWASPKAANQCDILMPGAWYGDNKSVPPKAFGANSNFQVMMYRGDRLGLPLVAVRDKTNGTALVMERVGGSYSTFTGDSGSKRLIDERLQVGALGLLNAGNLEPSFSYPGTEDERALLGPDSANGPRFAPRSHPVKTGVTHQYTLHFGTLQAASFAGLVETTTKAAVERAHTPLIRTDLKQVYRASLDLLSAVIQPYNGTVSVPFQVGIPNGEIKDTSMQMGFVGEAIPCTALLLKDGLESKNQDEIERATQVVDFWVQQSPNASGVPKNWADFPQLGRVTWRGFPTHLRVASDGMQGVLQAWQVARSHGIDKPQWLQYARSFGDFLSKNQNDDGSWYGSWNFDGTPHDRFTNASTHPLEFMVELWRATGDIKYQQAALRAGEFCWRTVHLPYSYVGGTPDNPNVTDKEAGVMAVKGFMALYDATGERKWLDATKQAALFCETWTYWHDLPMPDNNTNQVFPNGRGTVGLSLISTGHAGVDNFMAVAPFLWYRIYLATGDKHFLSSARLLLHDTKQVMDWDGKLGYKYRGLMPEAMGLSTNRGRGVAGWLPWLTIVVTQPLVQLEQTFGSMDIDEIEKLPLKKRQSLSANYGKTRGF